MKGVAGLYSEGVVLTGRGEPRRLTRQRTVGPLFPILGLPPQLGRGYREGEERVVVLSHKTWQTYFGQNPDILGTSLNLSQTPYTVVGVMPPILAGLIMLTVALVASLIPALRASRVHPAIALRHE